MRNPEATALQKSVRPRFTRVARQPFAGICGYEKAPEGSTQAIGAEVWFKKIQTNDLELTLNLPTKEGLSVNSQISILYKLTQEQVPDVIKNLGLRYETIISNVFRSSSADVCAQHYAKDLHSGMRADIEKSIKGKMNEILGSKGIQIDAVLMKSIQLPPGLSSSIEQKLQAEQDVMRMEFTLKQAKLEADRKIIEAKGTSDAQKIISEGLTQEIIKIRSTHWTFILHCSFCYISKRGACKKIKI
jgi:regulator of protease activity HflC (stomatin/prohibitin superfamily)